MAKKVETLSPLYRLQGCFSFVIPKGGVLFPLLFHTLFRLIFLFYSLDVSLLPCLHSF